MPQIIKFAAGVFDSSLTPHRPGSSHTIEISATKDFPMLFQKKETAKPQLPQKEREAIVDLLHLCLYADSHIALKEGEFLSDVVDVIGWETQSSFSSYESRSIASARAAKESDVSRKEFLSYAASRLNSKESRVLALDLCRQLFATDGSTAEKESALLGEIRGALK